MNSLMKEKTTQLESIDHHSPQITNLRMMNKTRQSSNILNISLSKGDTPSRQITM